MRKPPPATMVTNGKIEQRAEVRLTKSLELVKAKFFHFVVSRQDVGKMT